VISKRHTIDGARLFLYIENRKMSLRRLVSAAIVLLLAVSAGPAQNLVEAAKKEKERRAAYKNKSTAVLTNDALARLTKQAAISSSSTGTAEPETSAASRAAGEDQSDNSSISRTIVPQVSTVQPTPLAAQNVDSMGAEKPADLESRWQKAKEYADLLELKMNALWQEFYSMDDMTSRDKIQQEISATFEKYTRARQDEASALAALEKQKSGQD
jgi:hypothetical protein